VWVKSTKLGVGKAQRKSGGTVLVFRYSPPGNFLGQFPENVKPTSIMHVLAIGILSLLLQTLT